MKTTISVDQVPSGIPLSVITVGNPLVLPMGNLILRPNFASSMAITAGGPTSQRAYFTYVGFTTNTFNVKYISFGQHTNDTAITSNEVGLFSTPSGCNKINQTVTKLISTTGIPSTLAGSPQIIRNSTALNGGSGYDVPAGIHLWVGQLSNGTLGNKRLFTGLDMGYGQQMYATMGTGMFQDFPTISTTLFSSTATTLCPELVLELV